MQKDFHYYCIAVLARAAGFNRRDALTVAYASQYVDDSTESTPIKVDGLIFDPVRTAHKALVGYLKVLGWSTQKRVLIPFHFIPPKPIRSPDDSFVTQPGSSFALSILDAALKESRELLRLCRIGVALHTLADTWSHKGFSGRDHEENDVESIQIKKDKGWERLLLKNVYLDALPEIGHAEADYYPDYSYLTWKYKRKMTGEQILRHNTAEFLVAAEKIYRQLLKREKPGPNAAIPWEDICDKIHTLLANPEPHLDKKCKCWSDTFEHMFSPLKFEYDHRGWRDKALRPRSRQDTTDWDDIPRPSMERLEFSARKGFYDSAWVQFHRAALMQRHSILERLL